VLSNISLTAPWWILVAVFWLFTMANFGKDGGATAPYSDTAAPHVGWYGRFLAHHHGQHCHKQNNLMSCRKVTTRHESEPHYSTPTS